jgi:voltage-gated potassium channel
MDERSQRIARRFNLPVLIAAGLTVPVILLDRLSIPAPWRSAVDVVNWAIWLTFLAEAVVMLVVVPSKWTWVRKHPLDIAIVVLTPPFITNVVTSLSVLRVLRLLPLLRLGRLVRTLLSAEGLRYAALLALLTAFASGAAFASIENTSIGAGFYWAMATMTTVGYGDVVPTTAGGRAMAVVVMLVGTGFYALVVGAIAQRFAGAARSTDEPGLDPSESSVVKEIRELSARLERLERTLTQQHRSDQ